MEEVLARIACTACKQAILLLQSTDSRTVFFLERTTNLFLHWFCSALTAIGTVVWLMGRASGL